MSEILQDVEPWIAKAVYETITFDPQTILKVNRETHLAQVVKPPQIIGNQDKNNDGPRLFYLVISDGLNSIPVFCKRRKLDNIESGVLVRIPFKHWSISHTSLMQQYPRQNGSGSVYHCGPFCMVLYETELVFDIDHTRGDDEADARARRSNIRPRPCIETIACGGMGIAGSPVDVHSTIGVRRALIAIPSNSQRLRQVIDCFNYSLNQNDGGPEQIGRKFIPSPNLMVLARLDEYPTPKVVNALVHVNKMYEKQRSRQENEVTPTADMSKNGNTPTTTHQDVDVSGLMSPGTPLAYQRAHHAHSPHPIQGITAMLDDESVTGKNEKCGDESEQDKKSKKSLDTNNSKMASRKLSKKGVRDEVNGMATKYNRRAGRHVRKKKDRAASDSRENKQNIEDTSESVDLDAESDSHPLDTQPAQHVNVGEIEITMQTRQPTKSTSLSNSQEKNLNIAQEQENLSLETQLAQEFHSDNDETDREREEVFSDKPSVQEKAPNDCQKATSRTVGSGKLIPKQKQIGMPKKNIRSLASARPKISQKAATGGRRFRMTDLVRKRKPAKSDNSGQAVKKNKASNKKGGSEKRKPSFDILDWMKE